MKEENAFKENCYGKRSVKVKISYKKFLKNSYIINQKLNFGMSV